MGSFDQVEFAQNLPIPEDIKKWNKDEITTMENIINRFILLIGFYFMSSEDFLDKVYPFRVPEDMINNILAFHMKKQSINTQPPRKLKSSYDSITLNLNILLFFLVGLIIGILIIM
ncbi:hypothetical protein RclHR1_07360002 [Rhizophagus clarus]|uniref:Uncharacterized protein n=1 Tax=Rhizophagus clarus TaxID=94130 RepID=A0A2Z6SL94_9GLOM|nr:hypothetical protein RclHR1_07360002 [Rhizophagus clarus]